MQRNTALHASKLFSSRVLDRNLDMHRVVAVVLLGYPGAAVTIERIQARLAEDPIAAVNGEFERELLDGHSRVLLAKTKNWIPPERAFVLVYVAADAEAAAWAYEAMDSPTAAKTQTDDMQSMLALARIEATSNLIKRGTRLSTALNFAIAALCGRLDCRGPKYLALADQSEPPEHLRSFFSSDPRLAYLPAVHRFRGAIQAVDLFATKFEKPGTRLAMPGSPVELGAAITIVDRDPADGLVFLEAVNAGKGTQGTGRMDAIFVWHHLYGHLLGKRRLKPAERGLQYYCGLLNAYDAWRQEKDFKAGDFGTLIKDPTIIRRFNPVLRQGLAGAIKTPAARLNRPQPLAPRGASLFV
jgi:hypothetical protein